MGRNSRTVGDIIQAVGLQTHVFGSFAESSSNVKDFVEMAVDYGVEHCCTCMAASTPGVLRVAMRRRIMAHLSIATWRGYVKLVLDRAKYVGTGTTGTNMAHIRQGMLDRANAGEYIGIWRAHKIDIPPRDASLTGWGGIWGDALD
jgi:hypothetical protein